MVTRAAPDIAPARRTTDSEIEAATWDLHDALISNLRKLGVRHAFGILGGAIADFCQGLKRHELEVFHARHESGAAFMAAETYFATNRPSLVFTTTGPGLTNAITGLTAAASEGAKVLCVAAASSAKERGRFAFQETSGRPPRIETVHGSRVHSFCLDHPSQLPVFLQQLASAWCRSEGHVAILLIPPTTASTAFSRYWTPALPTRPSASKLDPTLIEAARRLSSGPALLWVGFGARHSSDEVQALAEHLDIPVVTSARAKGVFPEDHRLYVGTSGLFGGHEAVWRHFATRRPDHVLVVGTKLGEATSCFDPALTPRRSFIHVDLDPDIFGLAFERPETLAIQMDAGECLTLLREMLPPSSTRGSSFASPAPTVPPALDCDRPVHPLALMAAVQRQVVDLSDAVVFSDIGNSFAWTNLALRFREPHRYRTFPSFGAMTHAVAGAVGAALATKERCVAIVGDGAMLMSNEISTAVLYGARVVWIVLNDARYGMIRHGMKAVGMEPFGSRLPATRFDLFAQSLGADGMRVTRAAELDEALGFAMRSTGPFLLDVAIDPEVAPPFGRRNVKLLQQMEKSRQ